MRHTVAAVAVALSLAGSATAATPSAAEPGPAPVTGPAVSDRAAVADRVLTVARDVLGGAADASDPSPTLALRDLFMALPDLDPTERKQAHGLLARPTQGANDPNGDGYTVPSKRTCSGHICLHWVNSTEDAPPDRTWVGKNLKVMKRTWQHEVGTLDYPRPPSDGTRGGGGERMFDVYLADVGAKGYYGYCAPERRKGDTWRASGYCVLDDDFARAQFGARPMHSLRVTAAHEFFHAIQFGYDYGEDRWLMENTATWMEERVADDVNDNRQFLPHGQISAPGKALDIYHPYDFNQYGNWVFFEYLSHRFGTGIVRKIWNHADGKDRNYSTRAVRRALPPKQSFTKVFRAYAAANTVPGTSYPEGDKWPTPTVSGHDRLGTGDLSYAGTLAVDHMASRVVVVRPGRSLETNPWTARVRVDGPQRRTSPTAIVVVQKRSGRVARHEIDLDREGRGTTSFRFNRSVRKAMVVLVNASTRFNCWEQSETYSCQGSPRDDGKKFGFGVTIVRR